MRLWTSPEMAQVESVYTLRISLCHADNIGNAKGRENIGKLYINIAMNRFSEQEHPNTVSPFEKTKPRGLEGLTTSKQNAWQLRVVSGLQKT